MADPIVPGIIRAQAVLTATTAIPRDNFVNTFHFLPMELAVTPEDITSVQAMVADFYTHVGGSGHSLGDLLGASVSRVANACLVNVYDLGNAHPRPPHTSTFTMPARTGTGVNLPLEVACVASMYADRNIARHRGRIYLGPLQELCMTTSSAGVPIVAPSYRDDVIEAMERLVAGTAAVAGVTPQLAVYSRADGVARVVQHGWVDDAFDTQRRRGPRATTRTVW
jgi:hypothetical protein